MLVAGCQRSGTTLLSEMIQRLPSVRTSNITTSRELDAALILSGVVSAEGGRWCFQTTYLNENWPEYRTMRSDQKLIWMIRRPESVVWSMTRHWDRSALEHLYHACDPVVREQCAAVRSRIPFWNRRVPSTSWMAVVSYVDKMRQLSVIRGSLTDRLLVVDYDDLVTDPQAVMRAVCGFIGSPYDERSIETVHTESMNRAESLTNRERTLVRMIADPPYRAARRRVLNADTGSASYIDP